MAEKKQELEKRLQDVTGQLGNVKKTAKKGQCRISFFLVIFCAYIFARICEGKTYTKVENSIKCIKMECKVLSIVVCIFIFTEDSNKSVDVVGTGGATGPSRLSASSSSSSDSDSSSSSLSSSSSDSSDSEAGQIHECNQYVGTIKLLLGNKELL